MFAAAVDGWSNELMSKSYVTTDGQSVLEQSTHLGPKTRYLLVFDNYGSVFVERPL
jgi:hypothetical protein